MSVNTPNTRKKNQAGGSATASGMSFQAAVTAFAGVHMLQGKALDWLKDLHRDVPVAIQTESGGPGDDLRIDYLDGCSAEVQVKKGLRADQKLWKALDPLAHAIHEGSLDYGILVVDPESSGTIRDQLRRDILKISGGQNGEKAEITRRWQERLDAQCISLANICKRLRIVTFHGTPHADLGIALAKTMLGQLLEKGDPAHAWAVLLKYAGEQIGSTGRMTAEALATMLHSHDLPLKQDRCPATAGPLFRKWVTSQYSTFSVPGLQKPLALNCLLSIEVDAYTHVQLQQETLETALKRYRSGSGGAGYRERFNVEWLARFKKQSVIVAGPGFGKSTAWRVLAHRYSLDGYCVLAVRLKQVASAMRKNETFKDAALRIALGNSPMRPEAFYSIGASRWVLLADGLDECGADHDDVARELRAFVSGNAGMRAVVTTRQVGYHTAELADWAHYRIIAPEKAWGKQNLSRLMVAIADGQRTPQECERIAEAQLQRSPAADTISTSPQLLAMSAWLLLEDDELPGNRTELYLRFLKLYEQRASAQEVNRLQVAQIVPNMLGWHLRQNTVLELGKLKTRCVTEISDLTHCKKIEVLQLVDDALEHWERLGLIDTLRHKGKDYLTFTHLSFAEFFAARRLLMTPEKLLDDVIYDPQWQEVVSHAVGLGLGPTLVDYLCERHVGGAPQALCQALRWARQCTQSDSELPWKRLIDLAKHFVQTPIGSNESDRYQVANALCDVAEKCSRFLKPWLTLHLCTTEPAFRLIIWSLAAHVPEQVLKTEQLPDVFSDLLQVHGKPFDVRDIIYKRERHEALLLQRFGLAVLRSLPVDDVEAFSDILLKDGRLSRAGEFQFEVRWIRYKNGIREPLSAENKLPDMKWLAPERSLKSVAHRLELARRVSMRLAQAFQGVIRLTDVEPRKLAFFPQFAAVSKSLGFDNLPLDEILPDDQCPEAPGLAPLLPDFARLLGLDLAELAWEASEVLRLLECEPEFTLFGHLPRVDFDDGYKDGPLGFEVNVDSAKAHLLQGSKSTMLAAVRLLLHVELDEQALSELLCGASGTGLELTCLLTEVHQPQTAIELLTRCLQDTRSDQVWGVLDGLGRLQATADPARVLLVTGFLTCAELETVASAIDLLKSWAADKQLAQSPVFAQALTHWRDRPHISNRWDRNVYEELQQLLRMID